MSKHFQLKIILLYGSLLLNYAFAGTVCYSDLGCFTEDLPCHRGNTPESPDKIQTKFFLYTPETSSTPETLDRNDDASIINSKFRPERDTKIIIHGFDDESMAREYLVMKDAMFSIGVFNVILVDWSAGAKLDLSHLLTDPADLLSVYKIPRQNSRVVGREIGKLTEKLNSLKGASFSSMHLIGFSLGAQAAGYSGEYLSGQYGRITGLDPAGPGFEGFSEPGCFLGRTDAAFVDIIHTDNLLGYDDAVGDQDFYPSGGQYQVSCDLLDHRCYHVRAIDFFTESITTSCPFLAYPCTSWSDFLLRKCRRCGDTGCSRMGFYADQSSARGSFMLNTAKAAPYCLDDSGVPPSLWDIFG